MSQASPQRHSDDFLDYYQKELSYILAMGEQFQSKYRGVSAHLQVDRLRDDDPHVSRLIEGFAFLTARIRAKLDDEFPEITEAFLGLLYPNLIRPFPSSSVVQFTRRPHAAPTKGGETIEAGTSLKASHVNYRGCRFRTVYPVTLWPLEIKAVELLTDRISPADRRRGDAAILRLVIRSGASGDLGSLGLDRLRLHFAGEDRVAYALYDLVGSSTTRVEVRTLPTGTEPPRRTVLGARAVETVGFAAHEGMVPYPRHVPRGYRFIQEYACFPHKFLFIDLVGLEAVAWDEASTDFEILIFCDRTPKEQVTVSPRHIRLGCTPIVNLFKAPARAIRLTGTKNQYPVVPDVSGEAEIFRIDRVAGAMSELAEAVEYRPFYDYRPDAADRNPPFWLAHRRRSAANDTRTTEFDLSFVGEDLDPFLVTGEEVVSVSLTCSNGDAPLGMPIDQRGGDFEPEGPITCGPLHCLLPPSRSFRPATGRGSQWRLIANLSLNYLSLAAEPGNSPVDNDRSPSARDALVELLNAYSPPDDPAVRDRIGGIASVSGRHVLGPAPGGTGAVGGVEVTVRFDESRFLGDSSFLLENVLDRFFGLYVSINSFSRLVVIDEHGKEARRRPARSGEKPLL